jgi:superfamily II DNA or RNA helicase
MDSSTQKRRGRPPKAVAAAKAKATAIAESAPEKKRRGRPPKNGTAAPAPTPSPTPALTKVPAPARKTPVEKCPFYCRLGIEGDTRTLSLIDAKGKPAAPDFRQTAGLFRETLLTFAAERERSANLFRWNEASRADGASVLSDPSPSLCDLAVSAGILVAGDLSPYRLAEGSYRLALEVDDPASAKPRVTPVLRCDGDGANDTLVPPDGLTVIHQTLLSSGLDLYRVPALGPRHTRFPLSATAVKKEDLVSWLSLALSSISALEIIAPGYASKKAHPVSAKSALLFREIDAYGFLHVRPLVHLDGYPVGFFDDQDLIRAVKIDVDAKELKTAEVLYPEPPEKTFRALLSAFDGSKRGIDGSTVHEESGMFLLEGNFAATFLGSNMNQLMRDYVLLQAPVLEKYKLRVARPKLRLSVGTGIDYFEGSATVALSGDDIPFGAFMAQYRKNGFITLSDGTRAWPEIDAIERFDRLITKAKGGDDAVAISFFDIPSLSRDDDVEAEGDGWDKAEGFFRGYNAIAERKGSYAIPSGTLRPYQVYGVKWLEYLRDNGLGGCLADEMGLGKTVQVITLLRKSYESGMRGATLILVPRSLVYNWEAELSRFAPSLRVLVYYGLNRDAKTISAAGNSVIISSYATIRNDIDFFSKLSFSYVILDESQNVKNLGTQTSAAVLSLRAEHRVALSGTPLENSLADLYSLFRFLNPRFFGSQQDFLARYLRPIQEHDDERALRDLKQRIYPFMLRRAKRDVLSDLPAKTEQTAFIELSAGHQALYNRRRDELKKRIDAAVGAQGIKKSAFVILQALTELRRLAGVPEADGEFDEASAKRDYIKDMVAELVADGHKCLIFTNFLASVELVSQDLADAGIENLVMTGATGDRQSLVNRFQSDPAIGAFVMTLKTGGVGLNLIAADYVFIFDPWWNRAAEAQATDRTHRIGQKNPVFCYRMIAKGTIEEKILELQERKANLAETLLSADGETVKTLTEDDIEYLLG